MRTDCAVCGDILLKRVRCVQDGPLYMHHKDVAANDMTWDDKPDYCVVMIWCHTCDILYRTE